MPPLHSSPPLRRQSKQCADLSFVHSWSIPPGFTNSVDAGAIPRASPMYFDSVIGGKTRARRNRSRAVPDRFLPNYAKLPPQQIREACRMSTTVEVLATAFKDAGTPFIVGHPGGESVELMEAARQRQMRFLLMKQEVAGAMLASTWGDLTGSPGICLSTRGPGAANMINGIAHAYLDRAPLIAITDAYSRPTYEIGL